MGLERDQLRYCNGIKWKCHRYKTFASVGGGDL